MAFFFMMCQAHAQKTAYFQQEVNYKIKATLNDLQHQIKALEEITYINQSSVALDTLYFHLWPNAYSSATTALSNQLLESGNSSLYFSQVNERGGFDSLSFSANGKAIKWSYYKGQVDMCYLLLEKALQPGDTLLISVPFVLQIPDAKFSRLGHIGQAYYITQWYPKPAVFDNKGWHVMPYLNQGEFYSEFGSFDVSITLPYNYLLAATGDRIDAEEEENWLQSKVNETNQHIQNNTRYPFGMDFPPSDAKTKTIQFRQARVHDFAWFADKRFYVQKDQVELPGSGRPVNTWVFFTDRNFKLWKDAITYVNESSIFYSYLIGDYPYNQVTAVDGNIMAGSGMEYPNITVIGEASSSEELDMVIAHEVGHNWFYGILGSNEREHPFLDEGLNSLYEMRYSRAKYGDKTFSSFLGRDSMKIMRLNELPFWRYNGILYQMALKRNLDQPIHLAATHYSDNDYGTIVYAKSALLFDFLLAYLGEDQFDFAMRNYFNTYKFKHPLPDDLYTSFEQTTGQDLKWFRTEMCEKVKRIDYKISRVKRNDDGSWELVVKNRTAASTPFVIQSARRDIPTGQIWTVPFERKMKISFPPADADLFVIDGGEQMPEFNRKNNRIRTSGLFKKVEPFQLNFLTAVDLPNHSQLNWLPVLAANRYNGLMAGLALHNYGFVQKNFEFAVLPMYGYRGNAVTTAHKHTLNGLAELAYNILPIKGPRQLTIGAIFKSFHHGKNERFIRASPYIKLDFNKTQTHSNIERSLQYTSHQILRDSAFYDPRIDPGITIKKGNYFVNVLSYKLANKRALNAYAYSITLHHTGSMAKVFFQTNQQLNISSKKYFELRVFAGAFILGSRLERSFYAFRASGWTGAQDYLFEGDFYRRDPLPTSATFGHFLEKDGALKVWTPLGQSPDWLVSVNIKSPFAGSLPLRFFADLVATDARALTNSKVLWDAGINLVLAKDFIEVYLPLFYADDIRTTLKLNNVIWSQTIRFTFNIHKFEPKKLLHTSLF